MPNQTQLTKKLIESIKLNGKKQVEVIDKAEPVLRVITYPNKTSFVARVCWRRKRYSQTLGTFPCLSIPKARQLAAQFKLGIQTGEFNQYAHVSLREFARKHYAPWAIANNKTGHECVRRLENIILPVLGDLALGQIGRLDICNFLDTRATTVKPATVNRDHSLLSSVFRLAIEKGYMAENKSPLKGIKQMEEKNANQKKLPPDEKLKSLIALCHSLPDEQFGCDLILLLLYTGLRVSEALALKKEHIASDLSSFRVEENKSDRAIQLPLNSEARKVVRQCIKNSWNDYLFPSPIKKDRAMVAPRRLLKKLTTQAGIEEFGFHYCRAIFCSIVAKTNVHIASKLLNHSDIKVTDRYVYHTDEVMTSASELVVEHLK